MATAKTLLTAEDLLKLPHDGRRYELLNGELKELTPTGYTHCKVEGNTSYFLKGFARAHDLGVVLTGEAGVLLRRNPDRVRAPDVCLIAKDRLPPQEPEGFVEIVPDFVVEIVSPGDSAAEVLQKIGEWLDAGVRGARNTRKGQVPTWPSLNAGG